MHRTGWQWLLAVCALWVAGCTCGKPPVESELTVGFEQPVDGQRLAQGDDSDVTAEGFQYDVVAVAADSAGRALTLESATLEVQVAGETSWREGPAGVLDGARVRFPSVTLPGRTNVLRVTVVEAGSKRTATRSQSVTVGVQAPGLEIVSPAEGQVLREADDADPLQPGYQVAFEVRATGLRKANGLISCAGVCGIAPLPFTVGDDGSAIVRTTLSEPVREAQLSQCVAVVKRTGGDVTSPAREVTFDTEAPKLVLASPLSAVATTTFKVEAVVRSAEDGTTATLSRSGAAPLTASVQGGRVSFPEVSVPEDGAYDFQLSVTDSGGNVTGTSFAVQVASATPSLVLTVPDTVTTVTAGQPAGAEAVVTVDDQPTGTDVELWTTVTGRLGQPQRASTSESGGHRVARFPLSLAEGSNSVKACVRNAAGTQVCQLATTRVQTGRPDCRIVEPAPGSVLPAGGRPLAVRVEVLDNNGPVLLSAQGPGTATESVPGTASGGAATVSLNLAGEGAWTLVASCAGGGVSQAVTVVRDTTAPSLAITVRDAPGGRIEASFVDTSPLPGMQVVLDAVTEPFAQVLVQGCGLPATLTASADELGHATLRDVSVPASGSCSFSARAVDLAGNETPVSVPISSVFAASSLTFSSPDASRTLGLADGTARDGKLLVPMTLDFSAGAVGELKLFRDTAQVAGTPVVDSDTAKTFPDVQLAEGVNVLRAVLVNGVGAGACASALYTVNTQPGAITLTTPGASTTYNLSADRDPTTPGIQHALTYTLNGASPSATVDVCTSIALTPAATPCRDGSGWFTLASGVPDSSPLFFYPDGRYALKVVLADGGVVKESASVSMVVDGVRPEVIGLELEGDVNGDRMVNAAEWPTGAPVLRVSTTGLGTDQLVQVRDAAKNTLYGQAKSTGDLTEVPLSSLPPGEEADYSLVVVLTDDAGNVNRTVASVPPNPLDPVNAAAFLSFRLDRVAPDISPTEPGKSTLGPADDKDPGASFGLRASAQTSADVGPGGVTLRLEPLGTVVTKTPVGRSVSHDFSVDGTGTRDYMLVFSAQDKAGNVSTPVGRPVRVDLEAPVLSIVDPAAGSTLSSSLVPVKVSVVGGDGLDVRVFSQLGTDAPQQVGSFKVVSGVAQGTVNLPQGTQDVSVEAVDPAGNRGTAVSASVTVTPIGCDVALTSPAATPVTFNRADDQRTDTPGLQTRLRGHTSRCAGQMVSLSKDSTVVATTAADAVSGDFFFDVTLPDGEQARLTVEMVSTDGVHTNDFVDYTVDITPPGFDTVTPSQSTLTYVSASNVNLPGAGYVQDLSPGGDADAEFRPTVSGATGGQVRVLYQGTEIASKPVSMSPESLTIPLTLPQGTSGPLELRVRDAALNETVYTVNVTVDVQPPAQVAFTAKIPDGGARKAWVDLAWSPSGDDGTTGTPVGYDLRWTTDTQLPSGIPDEATYYGSKLLQETGTLLPANASAWRLTVPPLAKYFIEIRARDEVGNVSPFRAITTPTIDNAPNKVLTNPTNKSGNYGLVLASGDLDGDGKDELVTGDSRAAYVVGTSSYSNVGAVYIYSNPLSASPTALTLLPSTPTLISQSFGAEVAVGNVGDASGEGRPDVLVGSPNWSSARGRAFLYFGRTGQSVDPTPIEFRGRPGVGTTSFGAGARIIADLNGDGLSEVLLSADAENGGKGRVYLFFGRSRADWTAAATGNEGGVLFVPVDNADRILEGDTTLTATNTYFGRRRGQANVGDLDGDGKPELTLSSPLDTINRVYVYSGSVLMARTGATPAERTLTAADVLQILNRGPTSSGGLNGFGVDVVGRVDFTGGPAKDLVVSHPEMGTLRVFPDGGAMGFVQPESSTITAADGSVTGKRFFGYSLATADLNQDGLPDLVVGESATGNSSAWVLYNRGGSGAPFDSVAGDGFSQSRFKGIKALGAGVVTGDFNGDGAADVAAGDPLDTPGKISIWY